jgi:hypothetical protein
LSRRSIFMGGVGMPGEAAAFLDAVAAEAPWRRLEKPFDLAQLEAVVSGALAS